MEETKRYLQSFLFQNKIDIPKGKQSLFEDFISSENNITAVKIIKEKQQMIMQNWNLINRIDDITNQSVFLPNGTVNKAYQAKIDFMQLGWDDIILYEIENLEETGLSFDQEEEVLSGNPKISGDLKIKMLFKLQWRINFLLIIPQVFWLVLYYFRSQ